MVSQSSSMECRRSISASRFSSPARQVDALPARSRNHVKPLAARALYGLLPIQAYRSRSTENRIDAGSVATLGRRARIGKIDSGMHAADRVATEPEPVRSLHSLLVQAMN